MMKMDTLKKSHYINHKVNWYIYILELGDGVRKSKYYGLKKAFYTGITQDLGVRINEHVTEAHIRSYTSRCWHMLPKVLVYVEYPFFGTEEEAMAYENKIKKLSKEKKIELINSDKNILLKFLPLKKAIVIKGAELDTQELITMMRRDQCKK